MQMKGPDQRARAVLEQMSIEELEQLLYTPAGEEPDTEFIQQITEVILEKEEKMAPDCGPDVETAWEQFRENYQGKAHIYERSETTEETLQNEKTTVRRPKVLVLRRAVLIAAVMVLMVITASADVLGRFPSWSEELFSFVYSEDVQPFAQAVPEPDPYEGLRGAVKERTSLPLIPCLAPEGTVEESVAIREERSCICFDGTYSTESGESFVIAVRIYDNADQVGKNTYYHKDDNEVKKLYANGITHYVMSNLKNNLAVWINENVEVCISGTLEHSELEDMVSSVYWE